jgi:hypothetical protein
MPPRVLRVFLSVTALVVGSTMRMAVDSPHGDDAAHDAFRDVDHPGATVDIERTSTRVDRSEALEQRDREECYNELRAQNMRAGGRDATNEPEHTDEGGWKWKGLELDPAANRIADEAIATRREAEGRDAEGNYGEAGITPAMRRIEAELERGSLVPDTEKFALKSADRFKEKLAKLITLEPDTSTAVLAAGIHDGIRYTFKFGPQCYSDDVRRAEALLVDNGYELLERKPSWSGKEYKGINSQWRDTQSEQLFEVQFHTPESWDAKQRTHDAYEKMQCPTTLPEERIRLGVFQREIAATVSIPPGALEFVPRKAKGR